MTHPAIDVSQKKTLPVFLLINTIVFAICNYFIFYTGGNQARLVNFDSIYNSGTVILQSKFDGFRLMPQGDYLQSLFNIQVGINHRFNPLAWAAQLPTGQFSMIGTLLVGSLLLHFAIQYLFRSIGIGWLATIFASHLIPFVMNGINPFIVTTFNILQPIATLLLASSITYTALVIRLGKGSSLHNLVISILIIFCFFYTSVVFIEYAPIIVPVFFLISFSGLAIYIRSRNQNLMKAHFLTNIAVILVALIAGFIPMLLGLILNSSSVVFKDQMSTRKISKSTSFDPMLSFFLNHSAVSLLMALVICLSVIATFVNQKKFATALKLTVASVVLVLMYQVLFTSLTTEVGPSPQYFAFFVWPLLLFPVCLQFETIVNRVSSKLRFPINSGVSLSLFVSLFFGLWTFAWCYKNADMNESRIPFFSEPTPLAERLESEIGLFKNPIFRGRGAVYMGTLPDSSRETNNLSTFQLRHLYYRGIPVLDEYSHGETAQYAKFVMRFFMYENPDIVRNFLPFRKFNPEMLEMLGVRFVFSDNELTEREIIAQGTIGTEPKFVYQLDSPNIGDYSPTTLLRGEYFDDIYSKMEDEKFNPETVAVVTNLNTSNLNLVPVTQSSLRIVRGHIRLSASSEGQSFLTLPIEYSNCLEFHAQPDAKFKVFRVNGILTGVLFTSELNLDVTYALRYSPFSNCRLTDLANFNDLSKSG